MEHSDICRILADLAYEEHMNQTNNVVKEPKNCPYCDVKTVDSIDVTANRIEEKKGVEEINKNI